MDPGRVLQEGWLRRGLQPLASSVPPTGTGVDQQGEAQQVGELPGLADAVRATQEEGVVEGTVDGLRVVASVAAGNPCRVVRAL